MSVSATTAGRVVVLHGTLVQAHGVGVLITGAPGVGKSQLALELVVRGHQLIADDAPEFHFADGQIIGRCPPLAHGFLVLRNLGVVNVRRMFGRRAVGAGRRLDLILNLVSTEDRRAARDPLRGTRAVAEVLGVEIAVVPIVAAPGAQLAALAEAALRDRRLRLEGYDAAEDLSRRQARVLSGRAPPEPG